MEKQKVYFPNLNGLRFIAAFLVIIHHTEQLKAMFGMNNYWVTIPFIGIVGKLGVVLFFCLSGFLITYLLLAEEKFCNEINVKYFYLRRVLRIWPLYFLIILLSFFILPQINFFIWPGFGKEVIWSHLLSKLTLYILFLPNLVLSLYGIIPYASQTWSIGTEEQFYLVWPILIKYFKKKRILLMFFIIFGYLFIAKFLVSTNSNFLPNKRIIRIFWESFNIDCMAIGGIFAILLFNKSKIINWITKTYIFYGAILLAFICMLKGVKIPFIHYEFYSVIFGVIILNFSHNTNIKISLENKAFNYLGNVSYGLYMYHPIGIVITLAIANSIDITSNWLIYPLCLLITILIAGLSYKYFESYFLKLKTSFSRIISSK